MPFATSDRRHSTERRVVLDRRSGERRQTLTLVAVDRRSGLDRRQDIDRRQGERRGQETLGEHIRNALQLLANVAQSGALDDEHRRDLDAAMFRLRFALDRLEGGSP